VTAEFFGTFAFLFTTTLAVTYSGGETINVATSYGITLAVVIFITAPVSGGHINPAVSFALALHRSISWQMCAYYVVAQMLGAVAGVAVAYGVADELIGSIFVNNRVSFVSAFFGETIGTWFLITTVFATAVESGSGKITKAKISLGAMAPMIIGWSVWAIHFALIGITGCGVNPARYLATAIVLHKWQINQVWIYFLGPIVGAMISIPTYKILYPKSRRVSN
jgi:MIP family channel proteins